jgi:hypothetical protein
LGGVAAASGGSFVVDAVIIEALFSNDGKVMGERKVTNFS